jgi:TetR/AcrR family transcriptional regulator, transcriptional repressor for nem operon
MARPRSFDPEEIVAAALQLFWTKGYQGTSLDDITRATGIRKPSLAAAFGDKATLFARVLDRYHAMLLAHATATLEHDGTAREAVEAWLLSFLPACSGAAAGRGCLSVNATLDAAASVDAGIATRIDEHNARIEKLLAARIRRGVAKGDVPRAVDAAAAARAILAAQTGLMVLSRQPRATETVRATMLQALRILEA